MQIITYLSFDGRCQEAFNFYEKHLGGKIEAMLSHEGTPAEEHVAPEWRKKIMHAKLVVGDAVLMGGDAPQGVHPKPQGFCVSLHLDDPAAAERIFNALSNEGTIQMPLQKTFWATAFGMLTDRYGTPWMINCGTEQKT
jgi:PhnB protein